MKVLSTVESLEVLKKQMDTSKRVFYTRFGDGEIYLCTGRDTGRHHYTPFLGEDMKKALNICDPIYFKGLSMEYPMEEGMADGLFAPFPTSKDLIDRVESVLTTGETEFYSPVLFHYLITFRPDLFDDFIDNYIKPKKKMYIGCRPKKDMERIFGPIDYYVQTPNRDAHLTMEQWFPKVMKYINECEVCIPSAGSSSKVINQRLWTLGIDIHSIDFGSLCDIFQPNATRTWLKLKGEEIKARYLKREARQGNQRDGGGSLILAGQEPYVNTSNPTIDINVPFQPGNLAQAYNKTMERSTYDEWVLFLDHDAMILKTDWYDMMLGAIREYGEKAGWITCRTNEIWCDDQLCHDAPKEPDGGSSLSMRAHCDYSNKLYLEHGLSVKPFSKTATKPLGNAFSGVIILTNKKAWEDAGGFEERDKIVEHNFLGTPIRFRSNKFLGVDNDYFIKLVNAGYEPIVMQGLYAYHLRSRKSLLEIKEDPHKKLFTHIGGQNEEKIDKKVPKKKRIRNKKKKNKKKKSANVKTPQAPSNNFTNLARNKPKPQTLSVCLMTRASEIENPELNLRRCLASVKPIADEIVVLNTRTEDDPPDNFDEICIEYGCKIYHRPWTDHFSDSRNESIEHCTKDWIMLIDTDEELSNKNGMVSDFKKWIALIPNDIRSIKFTLVNILDGKRGAQFNPPKLFKRGTIKYDKRIHNVPVFFGPAIFCDMIEYIHYGYDVSPEMKERKFKRTSSLLHARLADDPEDYECYFYLSQIYGNSGYVDKQIEFSEEYIKHRYELKHIKFDESVFYSTVRAYMQVGKLDKAKEWLQLGLEDMPDDLDLLLAATEMALIDKDRKAILDYARKYIDAYQRFGDMRNQSLSTHFIHSYVPDAYAFCLFHFTHLTLSEGRAAYEMLAKVLPHTSDGFQQKMSGDVQTMLKALDLMPLVETIRQNQFQQVA